MTITARTINFTVNDGTSNSNTETRDINVDDGVTPQAPVLANIEAGALSFTEGDGATQVTNTITVTDADSVSINGATITISANYSNGEDVLAFVNTANITGSWTAGTGVLALSGPDTIANYQAALRAITFNNTGTPPASELTRTIDFKVNDGALVSNTESRNVDVSAAGAVPSAVSVLQWIPSLDDTGNGTTTMFDLSLGTNNCNLANNMDASNWVADTDNSGIRCLNLNGTDESGLSVANGSVLGLSADVTLSLWFRPDGVDVDTQQFMVMMKDTGANNRFGMWYNGATQVVHGYGKDSVDSTLKAVTTTPVTTAWHHVALVVRGTNLEIYYDGTLEATGADASSSNMFGSLADKIWFGANSSIALFFGGRIDSILFYNEALSQAQINALAASRIETLAPIPEVTLTKWIPSLDDASNGTTALADLSGNGFTATLENMTGGDWVADTNNGGVRALQITGTNVGTNDAIVSDVGAASFGITGDFTIALFFNPENFTDAQQWLFRGSHSAGATSRLGIWYNATTGLVHCFGKTAGDATVNLASTTSIGTSGWHHVAYVMDGGTLRNYLDGIEENSGAGDSAQTIGTCTDAFRCGSQSGSGGKFNGRLDSYQIFNQALTPSEVATLAASRIAVLD